jgi:hypothetical protein
VCRDGQRRESSHQRIRDRHVRVRHRRVRRDRQRRPQQHRHRCYKLAYRSGAGASDVTLATIPDGTTLAPGGFYLLGGSGYVGARPANQSFSQALAATAGGIGLREATGKLVDSVGYGPATNAFVEAHPAPAPPATAVPGSSDIRLPDGVDTDNNGVDFTITAAPTPGGPNARS